MRTAQDITKALGGKWYGRYGTAPCPVCQQDADKSHNALTISDGDFRLLMHCKKSNCAFKDLAVACGLAWQRSNPSSAQSNAARRLPKPTYDNYARKAWHEGRSIIGTPAETYLREARGLEGPYPDSLRFHPSLWLGPLRRNLPAMIARIDGGSGFSINRTFLRPDGHGKADIGKGLQKARLGTTEGGHVSLSYGGGPLVVAEGIETALSYLQFCRPPAAMTWASLGTAAMSSLNLPPEPKTLIIAADGDREGHAAARTLEARAADLGWEVEIDAAPTGLDWNDVLLRTQT
ncbi:toprim domain-containing protein [Nocardioides marinus]|nr:toprim domain-containing protein [Nocardioides marinus]